MTSRLAIAEAIRAAREMLYRAGRSDALRAVARGDYRTLAEAMEELGPPPSEPTPEEVEAVIDGWAVTAQRYREVVRTHPHWTEQVRAHWLGLADEYERKAQELRRGAA